MHQKSLKVAQGGLVISVALLFATCLWAEPDAAKLEKVWGQLKATVEAGPAQKGVVLKKSRKPKRDSKNETRWLGLLERGLRLAVGQEVERIAKEMVGQLAPGEKNVQAVFNIDSGDYAIMVPIHRPRLTGIVHGAVVRTGNIYSRTFNDREHIVSVESYAPGTLVVPTGDPCYKRNISGQCKIM